MGEAVEVLGRLLSDQDLRERFQAAPFKVATSLGLTGSNLELVCGIDPAELERQAETLLLKRWHEVRKLAPKSIEGLADGLSLFRFFARHYWPEGHRRHLQDCVSFLRFLGENQISVDKGEWRMLRRMVQLRK